MSHLLSIRKFIIVLIAACLLAVAEHHHDDFEQHEDCAICVLIHDGWDLEDFTPIAVVFWVLLFIQQPQYTSQNPLQFVPHYNPRGPPAIKT
jgi:hypothetical protein